MNNQSPMEYSDLVALVRDVVKDIAVEEDGNIWYSDKLARRIIARLSAEGQLTESENDTDRDMEQSDEPIESMGDEDTDIRRVKDGKDHD